MTETYGHTPYRKAFEQGDVYGIGYEEGDDWDRPFRLGLIGAGGVAQSKYFPAVARLRTTWQPVEIVAFAEPNAQQAAKVQGIYGAKWYSDYRQMLAQEQLQAIIVTSPDDLHAEQTIAVLEAGFPVLVEKPIARSLVDAQRMCQLADEKKLIMMSVANKRYSPPYRRAKRLIAEEAIAQPAMFAGKFNLGYPYVDLLESGTIHLFDLVRYFMDGVRSVYAVGVNQYGKNKRKYPVDNVAVTLEFNSRAVGSITTSASALSFKPWERVEIYGDHAWLCVEDQHTLTLYDSEEGPTKSWQPVVPNTLLFDEEFGGYMGIIENFVRVIRGEETPLVNGWDGYHAYELLVAVQLSMARKAVVTLPLDPAESDREAHDWLKSAGWPG